MGQIQETADNLAMLRSSGVPEAQISGYGGRLSTDEAQGILSKYNATKATGADVFTPGNVAQTLTNPVAPYDYSDPLKLQERVRTDLGLPDVEKQYQEAIANLRSFDTGTTRQQFGIEQELNPMGVIRGEQATALGQRSLSRQGFADTAQTLADRYNALQSEATNKFNILNTERSNLQQLMINNPGAGITYTDTIDKATQKLETYRVQQEKIAEKKAEEAQKKAYKDNLKSTALQLGIKTSGSTKEIEKRLKKYYGSQAEYNKTIQNLELQAKRQSLSSSGAAGSNKELTALASVYKQTGGDWGATASALADKGYDVSSGSVIDNELRRRNGLSPIVPQTATDIKLEAAAKLADAKTVSEKEAVKVAMEKKLSLLGDVSGRGVGAGLFGTIERNIPSITGAKSDNINTIKAIIGTETLNSLLNLKAQGGTLGAVSEKELSILQSSASRIGSAQVTDKSGNVTGYKMTEKQFYEK